MGAIQDYRSGQAQAAGVETVHAEAIRADGGTQPRARLSESVVSEYAESLAGGAKFPPVALYFDGESYWLADGFHRLAAYREAGIQNIPADIHSGTRRDAILHSVGSNAAHGLRRTNEDKRRAVETLLRDEEWSRWSDREIARRCGVHHQLVARLRQSLDDSSSDPAPTERTYRDRWGNESVMNTPAINAGRTEPATEHEGPGCPEVLPPPAEPTRPHVSNNSGNNEWYTPGHLIEAAVAAMGGIDLDPASSAKANELVGAEEYLTAADDGRDCEWSGRVWLNPPYSQPEIAQFCEKVVAEFGAGRLSQACVLTNNATETGWFQGMLREAAAVCFLRGRVKYLNARGVPENTPLQGQCVTYFGERVAEFSAHFAPHGEVLLRG